MTSEAGRLLTDAHRRGQAQIAMATAAQILAVWPLLRTDDLAGSTHRWLAAAVPIIAAQHAASASLAAAYAAAFRNIEVPDAAATMPAPAAPTFNRAAATTSLVVTGPVALRNRVDAGLDGSEADDMSAAGSAAAGVRHAINGGRAAVLAAVAADPVARGWNRVTSANACAFCDDIASEGPFPSDADFPAHDGCNCTAEPAY